MTERDAALDARLARLRERGARRRRHPARDSRIVAAGLGAGAMFGIVALLGLDTPTTQADTSDPATSSAVAASATVVIPRIGQGTNPIDPAGVTTEAVERTAPIKLTAAPVVRTITPAQAAPQPVPTAKTSGSR